MDLHLSGKTAVVTGASKGIGFAVTKALVDAGAHVVAGSRTPGKQLPLLEESGQVSFVSVDLTQPGAAEELIRAATYRGGIDVLINNVGGATVRPSGLASISDDEWRASWDLNVMGVVRPTRAALPESGAAAVPSSSSARSTPTFPAQMPWTTAPPRPQSPTLLRHCQKIWRRRTFVSIRSVQARCRQSGGWSRAGWPTGSPRLGVRRPTRSGRSSQAPYRRGGSPLLRKSLTSLSFWPATAPEISPDPTTASTADSSPPSDYG